MFPGHEPHHYDFDDASIVCVVLSRGLVVHYHVRIGEVVHHGGETLVPVAHYGAIPDQSWFVKSEVLLASRALSKIT